MQSCSQQDPRGLGPGFIYKESIPASSERAQFTLHLLMDLFFFFPKRKDFGSESSGEIEQHVVPTEPGAVSGCSGRAQNLK